MKKLMTFNEWLYAGLYDYLPFKFFLKFVLIYNKPLVSAT